MTEIRYCTNGCKRDSDGDRIPVQTEPPSRICRHCEDNLHDWLTQIPDLYALLPTFATPGTVDKNPESKATKRAEAPAPVRLEVLDLLDTRLGRIWNGLAPAHDRRGVLGTLLTHAENLTDTRPLSKPPAPNVTAICALLDRHRLWLAEQDWIKYLYDDTKQIHRQLSDATGDYRRPPVGHCHVERPEGRCNGPLFANKSGGVRCAKCGAIWDADHLRQLGLAQAAAQETTQESA